MGNLSILVQIISGAITTIVTIFLAFFTFQYVRLTKQMLDHMRASRLADLSVDIDFIGSTGYLVVRNKGGSPATEIAFEVEDYAPWSHGSVKELKVIRNGLSYLPSGRTLKFFIGYLEWKKITPKLSTLKVRMSYLSDGVRNHREVLIDLAQFLGTVGEIHPEEKVAKAVNRLADSQRHNRIFRSLLRPRMKTCPDCAEDIRFAAKRCHYCGAEQLPTTDEDVSSTETVKSDS